MADPVRIPPEEVRQKVTSATALLVCGYDDDHKFQANYLEGAISFADF